MDVRSGIRYDFRMSIEHLNEVLASTEMLASLERRFHSKVKAGEPNECWPWIAKATANYGYGRMTAGRGRYLRSHQVAWALQNGPIPDGAIIRHKCDNPSCCNPSHLELGSQADNITDAMGRGRFVRPPRYVGAKHPRAKLDDAKVREIRASKETLNALAERLGVSVKTIWRIRKHQQWKVP